MIGVLLRNRCGIQLRWVPDQAMGRLEEGLYI